MTKRLPKAGRPSMPDYGDGEWEPLPWSWVAERLAGNRNFWLVLQLAFGCGPRSRKARNLANNPRAVVMTDSNVECVSLEGTARRADGERQQQWIERYLSKHQPLSGTLDADSLRSNLMFEFRPERGSA